MHQKCLSTLKYSTLTSPPKNSKCLRRCNQPLVSFTSILQVFGPKVLFVVFLNLEFLFVFFWRKNIDIKTPRNLFVESILPINLSMEKKGRQCEVNYLKDNVLFCHICAQVSMYNSCFNYFTITLIDPVQCNPALKMFSLESLS